MSIFLFLLGTLYKLSMKAYTSAISPYYRLPYRSLSYAPWNSTYNRKPYVSARRRSDVRLRCYRLNPGNAFPRTTFYGQHMRGLTNRYRTSSIDTSRYRAYEQKYAHSTPTCVTRYARARARRNQCYSDSSGNGEGSNFLNREKTDKPFS